MDRSELGKQIHANQHLYHRDRILGGAWYLHVHHMLREANC